VKTISRIKELFWQSETQKRTEMIQSTLEYEYTHDWSSVVAKLTLVSKNWKSVFFHSVKFAELMEWQHVSSNLDTTLLSPQYEDMDMKMYLQRDMSNKINRWQVNEKSIFRASPKVFLNHYLESHLHKNHFLYMFTLQLLFYIMFTLYIAIFTIYIWLARNSK